MNRTALVIAAIATAIVLILGGTFLYLQSPYHRGSDAYWVAVVEDFKKTLPQQTDEVTSLVTANYSHRTITFVAKVKVRNPGNTPKEVLDTMRKDIDEKLKPQLCAQPQVVELLRSGLAVVYDYSLVDGSPLKSIRLVASDCVPK